MSRGIALAVPFALMRGHVMVFVPSLLNLGEFLIAGNGLFVMVGVRFARKLSASIAEIEAEYAEVITGLRLAPRIGPVSCELWLYSRYGTLRHFRIGDTGLVEIDCYGTPPGQVQQAVTGGSPFRDEAPVLHGVTAPGPSAPGTTDTRSPILRWLAKWNAERKAGKGSDVTGGSELKKILDAGRPGGKTKRASGKKPMSHDSGEADPADPEKNPGPEKPAEGTNPDAGKKRAVEMTKATVPEEKPASGMRIPDDPSALPVGTVSAVKERSPGSMPGSYEPSQKRGEDLR